MAQYIDKDALLKEIERRIKAIPRGETDKRLKAVYGNEAFVLNDLLSFIDTIEVIDPYEKCVQYASVESGIKAHAEVYSFNIESELFNQLTKEQQKLWRKEIEQACISGGYCGLNLAKDPRYKENLEAKEATSIELLKVKGFLVTDKDDYTAIYSTKPNRGKTEWVDGNHPRNANESSCLMTLNNARLLPDVEFNDKPIEVEVVIKAQKGEQYG